MRYLICSALFMVISGLAPEAVYSQKINDPDVLSVEAFGAVPDDGNNDRGAINKALEYCRSHNIQELYFPAGTYILSHPRAVELMHDVMNMRMGANPEKVIFTPYYPYVKGLDICGQDDLKLTGRGVTLLCRGWMEPVSIEKSSNIRLKGFTIDYERQPHSEGTVINVTDTFFDVRFKEEYPVHSNMVMPRIMFWDNVRDRLHKEPVYFPETNELAGEQTLRIRSSIPAEYLHSTALIHHSFHFRPAVLILESRDVVLDEITIHSQPGMGIVGHRSRNILMQGLRVVPRAGTRMSTNTDATHFTSCTGYVHFKECMFEGQGDDATNVHNYYYTIRSREKDGYITSVNAPTGTHAQVLDYPDNGDMLELVEKATLQAVDTVIVTRVDTFHASMETHLAFDKALPDEIDAYLLINITRLPRLHMEGCTILSHLARGILIKTRNVLIENCSIIESTGTGIQIAAEGQWHEGPGSADVVIRNNRIIRCGRGDGTQKGACGIAVTVGAEHLPARGVHRNLVFENNMIEGEHAAYGIYVSGADSVSIFYNRISGCEIPVYIEEGR